MKKLSVLCALALALCFGLVSCGSAPEDYTPNFAGSWELVQVEGDGSVLTQEDLATLKDIGMTCTFDLESDGTYSLNMFGEVVSGNWEATSAEVAAITMEGSVVDATLANEQLTLEQSGTGKLVFARVGAASSDASASAAAEAATSGDAAAAGEGPAGEG